MTIQLQVLDTVCDACAKTITQAILSVDSMASVKADTKTKQVTVETQVSKSSLTEAIRSAGYNPA